MKILAIVLILFLFAAGAFAASGQTADGNTRVELVYMTEIGDSNLPIDENYILAIASDELTGGQTYMEDGNGVRIGVFFTDFELINYKLFITLLNPNCNTYNFLDLLRFNVFSQSGQPITDINYILNGHPGLDLNGFCNGSDSNLSCARLDPNIVPYVTNTVTIYANNNFNIESVTCNFNYLPGGGNKIMFIPKINWDMILLLTLIGGGILLFLFYRRRRYN